MASISITYGAKTYTLEYTRASAALAEKRGFCAEDIFNKPNAMIPILFAGAFAEHHAQVRGEKIEEIYDHIGNRQELIKVLLDMYTDATQSLIDDPTDSEGNASWVVAG